MPHSYSAVQWYGQLPLRFLREDKFFGAGPSAVEYRFNLSQSILAAKPVKLELPLELDSKANGERVSRPQVDNSRDYPQTYSREHPSPVRLHLAEEDLGVVPLPDDPADARGALSHQAASEAIGSLPVMFSPI